MHCRACLIAAFLLAGVVHADVALPPMFSDGMVLQAGMQVPVWGEAASGEAITVEVAGQTQTTTADAQGAWRVALDPLVAGQQVTLAVRGKNVVTVRDVLTGEVWFASGQSNMEYYLHAIPDAAKYLEKGPGQIRLFKVEKEGTPQPMPKVNGRWVAAAPKPPGLFSAVGYLFAIRLHDRLNVPVGIVQATWGGTRIDTWTSAECLEKLSTRPELTPRLDSYKAIDTSVSSVAEHKKLTDAWRANPELQKPVSPCNIPSRLFNGMIQPVMPFAVRGVLWYQGESDAYFSDYDILFPAMIEDWRSHWGQHRLPFLFVQLPNYRTPVDAPPLKTFWGRQREAQTAALRLPDVGMVVTIDIGEEGIHPKNKEDVADRLLRLALGQVYGQSVSCKAPSYESTTVEGSQIRVHFKDAGLGLRSRDGEALKGFAIAGSDKHFVWADARIDGQTIVVSSDKVPSPVAVRYAYVENPPTNLVSDDNLPVAPFRSDDW